MKLPFPMALALAGGVLGFLALATRKVMITAEPSIPPERTRAPYPSPAQRDSLFGPLSLEPAPLAAWQAESLVSVPVMTASGERRVSVHRQAAPSLARIDAELRQRGLSHLLRTVQSFNPRLVRGGSSLSSHAYGTALDINPEEAPQGSAPTPEHIQLAWIFAKHGWFWGGWFLPPSPIDPHHYEYIGQETALV